MCASLVSCGSQEGQFTLYTQEEHLASVANTDLCYSNTLYFWLAVCTSEHYWHYVPV